MKRSFDIKKCKYCGAMVKIIKDCDCKDCGIMCCGKPMEEVIISDTHGDKIDITRVEDEICVTINHDMTKEHHIEWITLVSDDKEYTMYLFPEQDAKCRFKYIPNSVVYAYCNTHGIFSKEVK